MILEYTESVKKSFFVVVLERVRLVGREGRIAFGGYGSATKVRETSRGEGLAIITSITGQTD